MARTAIASNRLQPLQVALNITSQIPFYQKSAPIDGVNNLAQLFWRQIFRAHVWVDVRLLKDFLGGFGSDAINVRQRSFDPLISRYINSKYSRHIQSLGLA